MTPTERQLADLLAQNALLLAQMTACVTRFSFELTRSADPATRRAAAHLVDTLGMVSAEMERQRAEMALLGGISVPPFDRPVEEVHLQIA